MVHKGVLGLMLAGTALGLLPGPAGATTTRAEYAAQANPLCRAANLRVADIHQELEADLLRLRRKARNGGGFGGGGGLGPGRSSAVASERLPEQDAFDRARDVAFDKVEGVRGAEQTALQGILPAPNDEGTVGAWLADREEVLDLDDVVVGLRIRERGLEERDRVTSQAFDRKLKRVDHHLDRVEHQIDMAEDQSRDAAILLGAADCAGAILPRWVFG